MTGLAAHSAGYHLINAHGNAAHLIAGKCQFNEFEKFIPYIALGLLAYIGGKMLIEGIRGGDEDEDEKPAVSFMQQD